jgi:hypothetical protein
MLFCNAIALKDELNYIKFLKLFSSILTTRPNDKIAMMVIKSYGRHSWKKVNEAVKIIECRKLYNLALSKSIEMMNSQISIDLMNYTFSQQF